MNAPSRPLGLAAALLLATTGLAGCASQGGRPPTVSLDEPVPAQFVSESAPPIESTTPPPMVSGQWKPLPKEAAAKSMPESSDDKVRVSRANAEARIAPTREG